jgi:CRP/FNR family transcriptional regulator
LAKDEENIKSIIDDLNERTRELNCIYSIDEVFRDIGSDLDTIFSRLVEIIPKGWRYTDICRVQILYHDQVYSSDGLVKTDLKQVAKLQLEDKVIGEIQLYYIKPVKMDKGIFLPEEQRLLNLIAKKTSDFLLYKNLSETIQNLGEQGKLKNGEHATTQQKHTDWLSNFGLSNEEIEQITKVQIKFRKGETICKQGAISTYIMLLIDGLVKVSLEGIMDRTYHIALIKPYDYIAISSLYGKGFYNFSATAVLPSTLYLIDRETFISLMKQNSIFSTNIVGYFCENLELTFNKLSLLAFKQSLGRVAEVLRYLSDEIFENNLIPNTITRKDIADLAGISTENAVRILSELKNDHIINIQSTGIEILQAELLKTFSIAG